jgi:hypothetical protein
MLDPRTTFRVSEDLVSVPDPRALLFRSILTRWGDQKKQRTTWIIGVKLALFAMTHWLLSMAGSTTLPRVLVFGC